MGWQTTFTLEKRAKGCHLVTDEVLSHIRPGLEGVRVGASTKCIFGFSSNLSGRDVIPLHVRILRSIGGSTVTI